MVIDVDEMPKLFAPEASGRLWKEMSQLDDDE